jgi:hypothetical protein
MLVHQPFALNLVTVILSAAKDPFALSLSKGLIPQ